MKRSLQRSKECLWRDYFSDPSRWWDNRFCKAGPASPDFKHKVTKEPLWIDGRHNPPWVVEELRRRALQKDNVDDIWQKTFLPNDEDTLVGLLRVCTKHKNLFKGIKLHDDASKKGLLYKCSDALVTMYAKCGALDKAEELLHTFKSRDIFSWTALIAGYANKGQGQDALDCFNQMQQAGLCPDAATFACILKACASIRAADKGKEIHDEIIRLGLLNNNIVVGTALVDMYAKCGDLVKAQRVLEELPVRDITSWNALIAGYAQQCQGEQAFGMFKKLKGEGLSADEVTFACILKACGTMDEVDKGQKLHDEITCQGLLEDNVVLGNALVDMYAKCGALPEAQHVLEKLAVRDVVSWNVLISGYTQQGQGEQALECYERMQRDGLCPDRVTFSCILKACGSIGAAEKGDEIHDEIVRQDLLGNDIVIGTALVDMYARCNSLAKAQRVLEQLPVRNVPTWNALIAGYAQQGKGEQAFKCYEQMQGEGLVPNAVTFTCVLKACSTMGAADKGEEIHDAVVSQGMLQDNVTLGTALVDMYASCGLLTKAAQVFEQLPARNAVSFDALITAFAEHGQGEQALEYFERMQGEGLPPSVVTFSSVLKACSSIGAGEKGELVHKEIADQGYLGNKVVLATALVDMYAKCGALPKAQQVLEELSVRDVVAWNALIGGYVQKNQGEQAMECLERMRQEDLSPDMVTFASLLKACGSMGAAEKGEELHNEVTRQGLLEGNVVLGTALVDMYAKCGALAKAQKVLEEELAVSDVTSWNALISGFAQQNKAEEALNCFDKMRSKGLSPNTVTFACVLKACGSVGAIDKGEQIHDEIVRTGLLVDNIVLGTALVDMYAKCGALAKATQVLEELSSRDATSWNAIITGYTQQGEGKTALECFERMWCEGVTPDKVTYACVLMACSLLGLVDDAEFHFEDMVTRFHINPDVEHYTCMVALLGRVGHLEKAVKVIGKMQCPEDSPIWSCLLGACWKWENVKIGRWAFEQAITINRNDPRVYILMANIYAAAGMYEAAKGIEAMRIKCVKESRETQGLSVDINVVAN